MRTLPLFLTETRGGQLFAAIAVCLLIGAVWFGLRHPLVAPALAIVPLALAFVLKKPFPFVLGFVIFSFFRIHEVFPQLYSLRIPQLLAMGALVSLAWGFWTNKITPYWSRELSVFSVFFILVSIGVMFASNRGEAMASYTGNYIKIAIMVFAIAWLAAGVDLLRQAAQAIMASGIMVGAVALFNKANGIGLVEGTRVTIGRDIGSMLGDPNDLALVLLFPAGFALSHVLNKGVRWPARLLGIAAFLIVISAVVATQSRGGLLGIAAVMGIFAYRRVKSKALLFAVGAVALVILFALAGVSDRASGGAHEEGIDESAMGRLHAWGAAFRMALHNPFTGVGLDNFVLNYWIYSDFWDGQNHAVHSTWFGVLAESGFLGLLVFVTMMVVIFRSVLSALAQLQNNLSSTTSDQHQQAHVIAEGVLASLVGFSVSGTFLTMGYTWPVYILLALSSALGKVVFEMSRSPSQDASHSASPRS